MAELIPSEIIENKIFIIRGRKVMLDRDLADLYDVETKALNQAVKRNIERFPADFMFQLTKEEMEDWKSQFVTSNRDRMGLRKLPYAFTELGVSMLSSVLNSKRAIQVNIEIMRTFTRLREILATHTKLQKKIDDIIRIHGGQLKDHAEKIRAIFQLINQLLEPPTEAQKKKYGFLADRD
jgi:hypothetical protein